MVRHPILNKMQRRSIQQLNPHLVNRIAAGEVIERPAAVVKELVENAIDAGATSITVEAEDGGRALVRVIDNGGGIPPEELPLAFAQHATSKIRDDDDLFAIATMGFRGEALASVGAVSHARILSRVPTSDAAYEIFNRGGAITDPQAAAGNIGTTVEVRNLFYNTPARRKFIKGAPTEIGNISEVLQRLAVPHPHIAFKLVHNGRTSIDLPVQTAEQRMLSVWPGEFHELRLPIDARDAELRLHGLVGLPELARPTAKYQFLYLNGRHIRDRFIQHALREAYRGLTEPGRHPAAILMLEVPPADVDVNVHPTKIEVRFKDGGRIHGLVHSGVRTKLLESDLTPAAIPMQADFGSSGGAHVADAPIPEPVRRDMQERLASFFKTIPPTQMVFPPVDAPPIAPPAPSTVIPVRQSSVDFPHTPFGGAPITRAPVVDEPGMSTDEGTSPVVSTPVAVTDVGARPQAASPVPSVGAAPGGAGTFGASPAIQLHNSYLVAETPDGLVIIDQHALHERVMYEDLLARVRRGPLEAQRMLIPEPVNVSSVQVALLEHIRPLLERLGIEVTEFGPNTIAIHSFPSFLHRLEPGTFVRELLERGEQELLDLHDEELLHEVLDMMACKAAVKAGDPLSGPEIEALLARRDLLDRPSNCPHGRPTTLRLTLKELEKQFKRTGF
jgi:DNA mismatch repair protein MutL